MLSYTQSRTLFQNFTLNGSSTNLTFGDTMINEGIRMMLGTIPWPFLEKTKDEVTVASQQSYKLPGDLYRLRSVYIKVGTYKYSPTQITSFDDWNVLNNPTGVTNDTVTYYFIVGNEIQFWPTPATSDNTITFEYLQSNRDISIADYTTGTISSVTSGSKTVTGSGTSWTAGMAGHWIRITATNAANGGDGLWYQIDSIDSATTLTLVREYAGASISGGTAAYTIGDCSLLPEKYQIGPVYYAAAQYWRQNANESQADRYEDMYERTLQRLIDDEATKTTSVVIDDGSYSLLINPNLNRSSTS